MTTYDYSRDGRPAYADEKHYVIKRYIDFTAKAAVALDVWNLCDIPIYSFVQSISCLRITAAGAGCTADIADVTLGTTYESNLNLNGTGYIAVDDASNIYYAAADVLKMTLDHSNTAAKFWIFVEIIDLSDQTNYAAYLA